MKPEDPRTDAGCICKTVKPAARRMSVLFTRDVCKDITMTFTAVVTCKHRVWDAVREATLDLGDVVGNAGLWRCQSVTVEGQQRPVICETDVD